MLSIVTPNLNNASYIEDNIKSVMALGIPFEHIVVDGGSTDGSLEIIARYPHIILLHQAERNGMYGAIDQGFKAAQGEYVAWVNSDDRIVAKGYEQLYKKASDAQLDLAYSDGEYFFIKENRTEFGKGRRFGKFFLRHGCIPAIQPSILFSKKAYDAVGGFDHEHFRICGDLDLFVKIARLEHSAFGYVPIKTAQFMKRGDSLGDLNTDRYLSEIRTNRLPTPNPLVRALFFICKYV